MRFQEYLTGSWKLFKGYMEEAKNEVWVGFWSRSVDGVFGFSCMKLGIWLFSLRTGILTHNYVYCKSVGSGVLLLVSMES